VDLTVSGHGVSGPVVPVCGRFDGDHRADIAAKTTTGVTLYIDYANDGFTTWTT